MHRAITIRCAAVEDAGELLTLQRAAYVTEAQVYDDVRLPALTQSLDDLREELRRSVALLAVLPQGRVVGSVRGRPDGSMLHIGRLMVAPDLQGRGIGSALLRRVELDASAGTRTFALFTGQLSTANLRLYQRCGYREVRREAADPGVTLVHLEKPAGLSAAV